jgi:phage regulator Rha-like protein
VETRDINKSVKNNPDKFPKGYIIEVNNQELTDLRWKFSTTNISSMTRVLPKAFTEKGLYMLATILKSKKAVETTLAIVETFTRIRELSRTIKEIAYEPEGEKRNLLLEKGGKMVSTILDNDLDIASIETSFEINLAAIKFKHTVTRRGK